MIFKKIFLFIVFLFGVTYFAACSCNCGESVFIGNFVEGYIAAVGNDPFMRLAIKTDDGEIYILQCSKELENELSKKQGNYYLITFGNMREKDGLKVLIVNKAIPIETKK